MNKTSRLTAPFLASLGWLGRSHCETFINPPPQTFATETFVGRADIHYSWSGSTLTLSWDPGVTGYVLESAGQIPATSWNPVLGVVDNSVPIDTSTGTRFFRLHKH